MGLPVARPIKPSRFSTTGLLMVSVTLDTNCVMDLQEDQRPEFRQAMEELLKLAEIHQLDLAVTTRVESEVKEDSTVKVYQSLIEKGQIKVIPSTTRLGYWKLGVDVLPDEQLWKRIAKAVFPNKNAEILFRPGNSRIKGFVDVDHLYGHLHSKRDFFVTRDGHDIIKANKRLAAIGIQVCTPQELIQEIQKVSRK